MRILFFFIILFFNHLLFAQTIKWTQKANPLSNPINSVAFDINGQKVLSGTDCHPASIRVFNSNNGNQIWDYSVGSNFWCIMGVTFSSNSNYIAAVEEFGNIFLFDNTGPLPIIKDTINTGTSYGFATAISPSNDKLAVACSNGKLLVFNIINGELTNEIDAHLNWVTAISYSPNGAYIATGGSDKRVKLWNSDGSLFKVFTGHTSDISSVKFSPDNTHIISSSKDKTIKIWNVASGLLIKNIIGHKGEINAIDISPDGSKLVSAAKDSTCKIWSFQTGNLISTFSVKDSGEIRAVAWSPMGNTIVTGNRKSDLTLWQIPNNLQNNYTLNAQSSLLFFPNPTSGFLNLKYESSNFVKQFEIINAIGKVVYSSNKFEQLINVKAFSCGIYFIRLINEKNIVFNSASFQVIE